MIQSMEFSLEQLPQIAEEVIAAAKRSFAAEQVNSHATLITFSGDLGAGKTTLIQEIAKQLGVTETLQSPTYVIYKRYSLPTLLEGATADGLRGALIHGDMYRLESSDEIVRLGWNELLADPQNMLLIEWPEKIIDVIPEWAVKVTLRHKEEALRYIDIV